MKWEKLGLVYKHELENESPWWHSHTMAPSAILLSDKVIRVFMGCWDKDGISRIGWIDVDSNDPLTVIGKSKVPVLDIGLPGRFDENGVFPGHVAIVEGRIRLYYTGFQLGHKVPHFNFGGVALSDDGESFVRLSEAPLLDRADEGLCVRAGQSIIKEHEQFLTVYSAGTEWVETGGKKRPCYDVYLQVSKDGIGLLDQGERIIQHNPKIEHGLGRPQLVRIGSDLYVFYTRRILGMRYSLGCAYFDMTKEEWVRCDDQIGISHSESGFDSEMVYFPSVLKSSNGKFYLFYSGNGFGKEGFGVAELVV